MWRARCFASSTPRPTWRPRRPTGRRSKPAKPPPWCALEPRPCLTGERVALNFLQRLSGIATLTRSFVDAVQGTGVRILDTRKTTPTLRALEKYAVRAGGGANHRAGLYDAILIKDNHIAAAGDVAEAIARARRGAPGRHGDPG